MTDEAEIPTRSLSGSPVPVSPAPASPDALAPGTKLARYTLERVIGSGGMGVVYAAHDPDLDRALAIKVVRPVGERGLARVLREAQAMARLQHPNVLPVFDVGRRDEDVYLVMPQMAGGTLGQWLRARARPWSEIVARLRDAGCGLAAAHGAGLVHRDFKPDNVLIGAKGEVQVADFGLARVDGDASPDAGAVAAPGEGITELTRAGTVVGTLAYMAPEQLAGEPVDARADQFSFCVALHEAVWGMRPFVAADGAADRVAAQREAIRTTRLEPPPSSATPRWLFDVVARGLALDRSARWPSMDALLAAIDRGLGGGRGRSRALVFGVGGAALALALGGAYVATRDAPRSAARTVSDAGAAVTSPSPRTWAARPLTRRGDIRQPSLSPDGRHVAAFSFRDVVVFDVDDPQPRVLIRDVPPGLSLNWTTDSREVVTVDPKEPWFVRIDITDGTVRRVEVSDDVPGRIKFLGPTELIALDTGAHRLEFHEVGSKAAPRTCELSGVTGWMVEARVFGDVVYVDVMHEDESMSLWKTDRWCRSPMLLVDHVAHASITELSDWGPALVTRTAESVRLTPIAGTPGEGASPITLDGVEEVVGRAHDGRIVAQRGTDSWRFFRHGEGPVQPIAQGTGPARLELDPQRKRVAIREAGPEIGATEVRVVPIDEMDQRPSPVATGMLFHAWSKDGARIAGVRHQPDSALVVVEVASGKTSEIPVVDASPSPYIAWIDDHRVAYVRQDYRTYVWHDVDSGEQGVVVDPEIGQTIEVEASPVDGAIALLWHREDGSASWLVPPSGPPVRLRTTDVGSQGNAWTPDGRYLVFFDRVGGTLVRHERATGKQLALPKVDVEAGAWIASFSPIGDGKTALVQTHRRTTDLVVFEQR